MSENTERANGERTFAKGTFNSLLKRIKDAMRDHSPNELLNGMMEELRNARKELTSKHKEYLLLSSADDTDEVIDADMFLEGPENEFHLTKQTVFEHLQAVADRTKQDAIRTEQVAEQAKIKANEAEHERLLLSLIGRCVEVGRWAHYDDLCLETFFASFLVTVNK